MSATSETEEESRDGKCAFSFITSSLLHRFDVLDGKMVV
jgi:hypothetical protein